MKRKLYLMLIALCLLVCACGKEENKTQENESGISDSGEDLSVEEDKNQSADEYVKDDSLPGTLSVNLTTAQYCVDGPDNLFRRAYTGHILEMNSYFVICDQYVDIASEMDYGIDLTTIIKAEQIIPTMRKQMEANCQDGLIYADEYVVEITSAEPVKVNSWDMCKTKGTINLSCKWPLDYEQVNYVAYSVIKDGYPIYFAVVEEPLGDNPIDIEEMADKIAKTFRDNPQD